ncbi:hypothetical protein ACP4OV_008904 [Aristida adscensionis]
MEPGGIEKIVEVVPPASMAALQEEGATIKKQVIASEEARSLVQGAVDAMKLLDERISKLLDEAVWPRRGATATDRVRHCLKLMTVELNAVSASLRMRFLDNRSWDSHLDDETRRWLLDLMGETGSIHQHLIQCEQKQANDRRHAPMRKAAQLLGLPHVRYKNLLSSSSPDTGHPGLSPQAAAADAGGVDVAGIKTPAKKKLLRWLIGANKSLRVMSIVGPVGVGKTTLAMELYRQLECKYGGRYHFAMARCSRNPDMEMLRQHISSQIIGTAAPAQSCDEQSHDTSSGDGEDNQKLPVRDISELLKDKRYFILIDDIWTKDHWERLKTWLPRNKYGSRILITTQTTSLAQLCSARRGIVHAVKPLNKSDSRRLLLTKAFGSVDGCPQYGFIKELCDEILGRCGGIPLFIIGMADWMKQQESSALSRLELVPELLKEFEEALSPAFNELTFMSKLLSLYMSMFPQGYSFEKYHLLTKWTKEWPTQDIVWGEDGKKADEYFLELVDKNVITQLTKNYRYNFVESEACRWQVNYFMLQFLKSKSVKEGFIFTGSTLSTLPAYEAGGGTSTITQIPRRLGLHNPNSEIILSMLMDRGSTKKEFSTARSLAVSGAANEIPFGEFPYLVVLDLEGWKNLNDEQLVQICNSNMFLLSYLSIRGSSRVRKLPREINKLYSLEKLDISKTQISELPSEVSELERLSKLDLRSTKIKQLPEEIGKLRDLQELLIGGDGMINPDETVTKIPDGIRMVSKLETLATVDISDCSASLMNALADLESLRVLAIIWSFHQCTDNNDHGLAQSIKKWKKLESLTVHCGPGCCPMKLLGTIDPPKTLVKFKVTTGKFDTVPRWIKGLEHLAFLQITVCKHEPDDIKILKDLPKLRSLVLGLEFIPKNEIVIGSDGFSELQRFSLDCPVPWLRFKQQAMPKLKFLELRVYSGPAIIDSSVPSGIINLQGLMEVVLCYTKWCSDSSNIKATVKAVRNEVAKHQNPIDLIINNIVDDAQEDGTEWNDNLFNSCVNCLKEPVTLFQHRGRLASRDGLLLLLIVLMYFFWLHVLSYIR